MEIYKRAIMAIYKDCWCYEDRQAFVKLLREIAIELENTLLGG